MLNIVGQPKAAKVVEWRLAKTFWDRNVEIELENMLQEYVMVILRKYISIKNNWSNALFFSDV